ncbi:MAG: hypothetical protein ORN49_00250 [Rhodobacteraceae bacterium]|nr:hypothetical protein [Paracoccaceae bacterium]
MTFAPSIEEFEILNRSEEEPAPLPQPPRVGLSPTLPPTRARRPKISRLARLATRCATVTLICLYATGAVMILATASTPLRKPTLTPASCSIASPADPITTVSL